MAIAYDTHTDGGDNAPATSHTVAINITSGLSNGILVATAYLQDIGATLSTTGMVYNGTDMFLPANGSSSIAGGGGRTLRNYIFYLANPANGSSLNLVCTASEQSSNAFGVRIASYSGVDQSTPIDDSELNTSASTASISVSPALTSNNAGDWAVTSIVFENGVTASSTNSTLRTASASHSLADSNGTVGSGSITVTNTGTSGRALINSILLLPSTSASGPANLKSYDTNLKANIKSYNTNLIANVKSIDTNV